MSAGHNHGEVFEGMSPTYKRRLWIVIALNAGMFVVEMTAGQLAGSQALQADAPHVHEHRPDGNGLKTL